MPSTPIEIVSDLLEGLARGFDRIGEQRMSGADVARALREARDELVISMLDVELSSKGEHYGNENGDDHRSTDDEHDRDQ